MTFDFRRVDEQPDERGRVFYEMFGDRGRLGYLLLPPDVVVAIDAALSIAFTLHEALHPRDISS